MTYDCKVSIAVLGEVGVGKSSLLLRFAQNIFREYLTSTIIDCYHSDIHVRNKRVRLELWDTAGQERFKCVVKNYFRKADGVLLVYDVTDITSFHKLTSWFLQLKDANETAVSIIVGNKIDDPKGNSVAVSSVKRFANEQNLGFYESSAKTGENVCKIFEDLTEKVLEAKEIIPPRLPPKQNIGHIDPTHLNLFEASNFRTSTEKSHEVKNVIQLPAMKQPPQESVVKLHKTSRSVQKKNGCCG